MFPGELRVSSFPQCRLDSTVSPLRLLFNTDVTVVPLSIVRLRIEVDSLQGKYSPLAVGTQAGKVSSSIQVLKNLTQQ